MTWLEISGTVGKVAACLGFFLAGTVIFYFLTKVIYKIPEKQKLERLHEPGRYRNGIIALFGGFAAVLFTGFLAWDYRDCCISCFLRFLRLSHL